MPTTDHKPQRGGRDDEPSVRAAVAKFAIGGLAALIVLVGIGALALARISRAEAIKDAKRVTELVGHDIVAPNLTEAALRGHSPARERLDAVVRTHVVKGDLVRVKIWGEDGRVLYSDRRELVGARYRSGEEIEEELRSGGVAAEVSDLSRPENRFERGQGKLLEVYLPLRTTGGRRVLFETYQRFSAVTASGRDLWSSFIPALVGALLVFQLIQLPLAASLARRVKRAHRDREALLGRALDASQLERRRIAADLHDGIVQDLVASSYSLSATRERLPPADGDAVRALEQAEEVCREAVRELRSLLVEIYPPRLGEEGLASALEDLLSPLEQRGVRTSVESPAELSVPDDVTALLFRTAQEAVRNAGAHAEPSEVRVTVERADGRVALSVTDDGRGFSPEEVLARQEEGHFGLRLLSDQVGDAGGTFEIDSAPGRGTRLRVEVPAG